MQWLKDQKNGKQDNKMKKIIDKGHKLLSLFDIEYHFASKEITDILMSNPDKEFILSVKEKK